MNKFIKFFKKNEDGQILVLVALLIFGMVGFAALLTDGGMMQMNKRQLQAAADAAALAGASYLPFQPDVAEATAREYVLENDLLESNIKEPIKIYDDNRKIEVVLEKQASFTFGRIFNPSETMITARAVAMNYKWNGEALPFINQNDQDDYEDEGELWVKVSPGNFESMLQADVYGYTIGVDNCSFTVDYENGLAIDKGEVSDKKQEVQCVVDTNGSGYVFSLSIDAIKKDEVYVKSIPQGTFEWRYLQEAHERDGVKLQKLNQSDVILPYAEDTDGNEYVQLVLYEIVDVRYHEQEKEIDFKLNNVYDIFDRDDPEIPLLSKNGAQLDLVE